MENNKYHILIVEDDKEIRDGVEIYLKNQGYQVWKAANGKEGLEIVAQEEIHLAILDIMMLNSHPSFPFCKRVSHFESDLQILYPTFHFCNDFPVFFLAFMI